eukprot:4475113-Prymnesium_polylepis.2
MAVAVVVAAAAAVAVAVAAGGACEGRQVDQQCTNDHAGEHADGCSEQGEGVPAAGRAYGCVARTQRRHNVRAWLARGEARGTVCVCGRGVRVWARRACVRAASARRSARHGVRVRARRACVGVACVARAACAHPAG